MGFDRQGNDAGPVTDARGGGVAQLAWLQIRVHAKYNTGGGVLLGSPGEFETFLAEWKDWFAAAVCHWSAWLWALSAERARWCKTSWWS